MASQVLANLKSVWICCYLK